MKKLGLILLVVIMALGALGAAYAYWSQPLYVNGNVTAGTVAAQFSGSYLIPPSDTGSTGYANAGVSLGYSSYGSGTDNVLTITIANAYPGMNVTVPFCTYNSGTLPETIGWTSQAWTGGNATLESYITVTANAPSGVIAVGGYNNTGSIVISMPGSVTDTSVMGTSCTFQVVLAANQYN
jgi:hypothetical protein